MRLNKMLDHIIQYTACDFHTDIAMASTVVTPEACITLLANTNHIKVSTAFNFKGLSFNLPTSHFSVVLFLQ